jgi:cytochrome P450
VNPLDRCPYVPHHGHIHSFDMLDPEARANPFPFHSWLLADPSRRVYQAPFEKAFYVVHRYEDVKLVLTNSKLFSSAILPTRKSPFLALMDGADHLRIREIVNQMFQVEHQQFPKETIQDFIQQATRSLIEKKHASVFDEWATLIPLASIAHVLGLKIDRTTLKQLHDHAITINRALFVLGGTGERRDPNPDFSEKLRISFQLMKEFPKIWRLHKHIGSAGLSELKQMFIPHDSDLEFPRPDFDKIPGAINALLELMVAFSESIGNENNEAHGALIIRKAIRDGRLSKTEAVMLCTFILFAGYETSVSLLSNCVAHLAKDQSQFSKLKSDEKLIEPFMEEALRFYTPVGRFLRRVNEDVTLGDQVIPKGSMVIAMLSAANTDPERFDDPFTFHPDRAKNNHISFGKGLHFCVGAPLARLQALTALKELIKYSNQILLDETREMKMVTDRDNGIFRYEDLWIIIS